MQAKNLYVRSISYIDSRNYDEALNILSQSYEIDKHSYTAQALSYCYGMKGDYDQARFYANEALKLLPPLPPDLEQDVKSVVSSNNIALNRYYTIESKQDNFNSIAKLYRSGDPCIYTTKISEESPFLGQECPSGYAIKGIRCRGSFCDDKYLRVSKGIKPTKFMF
ncbi:tetratricopeptide repeat protein [uncultured Desulfobacter sp.]|uniref:tetratricopeptide repeat protein n=1 Tax=uncultured Desulfobacter sp. TaxID=240139 RepID=UPI0029F56DD0|nr:tetratricopeptide repeat protein [uncultured Desulfobacter sp.]